MKKTAIFVVSLFLLFTAKAQQAHFGLKGGVNVSQLHFNDNQVSSDSKVGLNLGDICSHSRLKNMGYTAGAFIFTGRCTKSWKSWNNLQFELPECAWYYCNTCSTMVSGLKVARRLGFY